MARLATRTEIETATLALSTLRAAIKNQHSSLMGGEAGTARDALRKITDAATIALLPLGSDGFNPSCVAAIQEFDKLKREADSIMRRLNAAASYAGPRRSRMSAEEKTKFIREHGKDAYFSVVVSK